MSFNWAKTGYFEESILYKYLSGYFNTMGISVSKPQVEETRFKAIFISLAKY